MTDLLIAIVSIGVFEGLVKPLLAYQTQRLARQYLPDMFNCLDPIMPDRIAQLSPKELEYLIFDTAMGLGARETEAKKLVKQFDREYSPIANSYTLETRP